MIIGTLLRAACTLDIRIVFVYRCMMYSYHLQQIYMLIWGYTWFGVMILLSLSDNMEFQSFESRRTTGGGLCKGTTWRHQGSSSRNGSPISGLKSCMRQKQNLE